MLWYIAFGVVAVMVISLPMDIPALANPFYSAGAGLLLMVLAAFINDRISR